MVVDDCNYEQIMAAANIASTGIVLEPLTKDNYENWRALVENYLVGQGLWHGIVESDPNKPDSEKDNDWRSKNAKALHAIQLACGSENLSNIRTFKKAREAWNHLRVAFSEDVRAFPDIEQGRGDQSIYQLHRAVKRGYWNDAKSYIDEYPDGIFSTVSSTGRTVLHVAVAFGHERIVKELVKMGNQRFLRVQDKRGYTALALAAELTDKKVMAEWMVKQGGKELLTMKTKSDDDKGEIPVLLASAKGHKQMTTYLFSKTEPPSIFFENEGRYGVTLLTRCISAKIFGTEFFCNCLQFRFGKLRFSF